MRICSLVPLAGALLAASAAFTSGLVAQAVSARGDSGLLTLVEARARAFGSSPELAAARAAAAVAAGEERQAAAFPNPTLAYAREQTSRNGASNSQDIAQVEQAIEIGGRRTARRDAARFRRSAADARVGIEQSRIAFEVTRVYALAVAADRRARLAAVAAAEFASARAASDQRLAAGDVSGYAARRVRLEAARYAGLRAEAALDARAARVALASLVGTTSDPAQFTIALDTSLIISSDLLAKDSLRVLAGQSSTARPDIRAAELDVDAARAAGRLAASERLRLPVASVGFKRERIAEQQGSASGFVAGFAIPLPLFDRRVGAIQAADAEVQRQAALLDVVRRRAAKEVAEAVAANAAAQEGLALLTPDIIADAELSMRAAQAAYREGEITLLEWLDAVRAHQETVSSFIGLQAESIIRRAALERALGVTLIPRN